MRGRIWLSALLLAGCGDRGEPPTPAASSAGAGAQLEEAAVAQGLIADPDATPLGAWARGGDRICVVAGRGGGDRIGVVSDYGDGQGCSGSGTLLRRGGRMRVTIGGCRFVATFDGERIGFPGDVPAACDTLCRGRASLTGIEVDRQSGSVAEAATLRGRGGVRLCG